jgi:hypothetical protein
MKYQNQMDRSVLFNDALNILDCRVSVTDKSIDMKYFWKDIARKLPTYSEKSLFLIGGGGGGAAAGLLSP